MLLEEFWRLVELARSDVGGAGRQFDVEKVAAALTTRLTALPPEQIVEFHFLYHEVCDRLNQWEMCAAAYVINAYISDNTFADFQAGVISLGEAAYVEIAECPDELSAQPIVADIASGRRERGSLNSEEFLLATSYAYAALSDDDDEAFGQALDAREKGSARVRRGRTHGTVVSAARKTAI